MEERPARESMKTPKTLTDDEFELLKKEAVLAGFTIHHWRKLDNGRYGPRKAGDKDANCLTLEGESGGDGVSYVKVKGYWMLDRDKSMDRAAGHLGG